MNITNLVIYLVGNMFYNRERELEKLEEVYSFPSSSFLVIYGRRRVGKTALVREILRIKPGVYFFVGKKMKRCSLKSIRTK